MTLKNIHIRTQLMLGLAILMAVVISLGLVAFFHSSKLQRQTSILYEHPFQVRKALGRLHVDVVSIQRDVRNLILYPDDAISGKNLMQIMHTKDDADHQILIIENHYLGPASDIDSLKNALFNWNQARNETINFILTRNETAIEDKLTALDPTNKQVELVMKWLKTIDKFAESKGDELYFHSKKLESLLNIRLLVIIVASLFLSAIIFILITKNIRDPLNEILRATREFHDGDLTVRSNYLINNEFGDLSHSFNLLTDNLQQNIELSRKTEIFERLMLKEDDAVHFFHAVLLKLCELTGSQIGAAYLLNEEKTLYEHFDSIGLDGSAKKPFSANSAEGEFGQAISLQSIQHIKEINDDNRFVYRSVCGEIMPREIITIPLIAGAEIIAVLSLASVNRYSPSTIRLIEDVFISLSTRVEGVIAIGKIKEISEKLEIQNNELELQKTELIRQSRMLSDQNAELEAQKNQLTEASRLKTNFLSNMSHELRTPLNSVIALTGVLNRRLAGKIPQEEFSYLNVIERNGKNLLSLINDILDISRIESGKVEIEISNFNLAKELYDLTELIRPQASQKKIELILDPTDPDVFISSDIDRFSHILQNIIGNAIKFTDQGYVKITVTKTEKSVLIKVTDTGIGISVDHLPHIFDEFRQADGSTSRRYGGTGLGLALARKYAQLLGGSISVISIIDKGSEFTLSLPYTYIAGKDSSGAVASVSGLTHQPDRNDYTGQIPVAGKTVMLVEDNEPAIIQISELLQETAFTLMIARNGQEALTLLENVTPDAIILDLMMPGIDGFQVLKSIRKSEKTSKIPVLILTAKFVTKEELSFLKDNNIHQLIRKGNVNINELVDALKEMVMHDPGSRKEEVSSLAKDDISQLLLIVEDNPDNMLAVKAITSKIFKVIEAVNGQEGIRLAKEHKPACILMDIDLPDINGIEAFSMIRKDSKTKDIPIIALTASVMLKDRETILAYGFDAFIPKPVDDKVLLKTIKEILYGS